MDSKLLLRILFSLDLVYVIHIYDWFTIEILRKDFQQKKVNWSLYVTWWEFKSRLVLLTKEYDVTIKEITSKRTLEI